MSMLNDMSRANPFEEKLFDFAKQYHSNCKHSDVRELKKYQEKDIDFIITESFGIEAKIDFYPEENFFFEIISNENINSIGCCFKTKAKYLWYYFVKTNALYVIPVENLQNFLRGDVEQYKKKGGDNAIGVVIPIKEFEKHVVITRVGDVI